MPIKPFCLFLAGLFALLTAGCGLQARAATTTAESQTLTVFAAASLTEAFTELAAEFEASRPGVNVLLNFAGSQTLRLQIEQGARSDLFASANRSHTQALVAAGLVREPVNFAHNRLVVIVPASNPAAIQTLADLTRPNLKLVLAGPAVPVGRYARESLAKLSVDPLLGSSYATTVLGNLVSEEENVKGVVTKVRLGEADAGIVYASDITPAVAADLMTITIPGAYNIEATYPLAIAANSPAPELARQFVDFALSPAGQTILVRHGFSSQLLQTALEPLVE